MLATLLYLAAGIGVITHVAYLWKGVRRLRDDLLGVREPAEFLSHLQLRIVVARRQIILALGLLCLITATDILCVATGAKFSPAAEGILVFMFGMNLAGPFPLTMGTAGGYAALAAVFWLLSTWKARIQIRLMLALGKHLSIDTSAYNLGRPR